jgi:hypothetical protein
MTPQRWYWLCDGRDSNNRPLVPPDADAYDTPVAGRPAGQIVGIPVYLDSALPTNLGAGTNEDRVIVTRSSDALLLESAPRLRVLVDQGSATLTVRLQLYRFVAFTAALQPAATSVVAGTGLTTPAFP